MAGGTGYAEKIAARDHGFAVIWSQPIVSIMNRAPSATRCVGRSVPGSESGVGIGRAQRQRFGDSPVWGRPDGVRRHYDHVFLVCFGVLDNTHDAEDVAQDAMLKGFEQIRRLRDGDQFAGWVVATARNLSINLLRRRKVAGKLLDGQRPAEPIAVEFGHEDLQRAVARLPQDLRLPLVMYYFDGQDVKAVARKLENIEPNELVILTVVALNEDAAWSGQPAPHGSRGGAYANSPTRGSRGQVGLVPAGGQPGASTTVLTMQAKKADVDAFARGELDFDEFRRKVRSFAY